MKRRRTPAAALFGAALLLGGFLAMPMAQLPASATPSGTWTTSEAYNAPFAGGTVTCPSASDCIIGGVGLYGTTTGGTTWNFQSMPAGSAGVSAISCATTQFCVAIGSATDPFCCNAPLILQTSNGGDSWTTSPVPAGASIPALDSVSCPTTSDCIILGTGESLETTNGAGSWTMHGAPPGNATLSAVTCTSAALCIAVGSEPGPSNTQVGAVFSTADLGTTWQAQTVPAGITSLASVACPSPSVCVATGGGTMATANGGALWTVEQSVGTSVSCASTTDCVAIGQSAVWYSDDGGTSWTSGSITLGQGLLSGVSCAAPSNCIAVAYDRNSFQNTLNLGLVFTSTDGGATWSPQTPPVGVGVLSAVSCGTSLTCTSVGGTFILGSIDGGDTWAPQTAPSTVYGLDTVACPTATECFAGGNGTSTSGGIIVATSDGGSQWAPETIPSGSTIINRISCWSAQSCIAVGQTSATQNSSSGVAYLTTDAGSIWTSDVVPVGVNSLAGVSCPTSLYCLAVGAGPASGSPASAPGVAIDSVDGGVTWTVVPLPSGTLPLQATSCGSDDDCAAIGGTFAQQATSVISTSTMGATWNSYALPSWLNAAVDISCLQALACVVAGELSAYPHGSGAMAGTLDGGSTWIDQTLPTTANEMFGTDCASLTECVAVGRGIPGLGGIILQSADALPGTPAIATTSLPAGTIGSPYSQTLTVNGGLAPFAWSVSSGTLPAGLSLNPSSGALTGTPTSAGTQSVTFGVTDANGLEATAILPITVERASTFTSVSVFPSSAVAGTPIAYSATVSSSSGIPTGAVAFTSGTLTLCASSAVGSSGIATCTAATAPVGTDNVTATYSGDPTFAASSGSTSVTVTSPAHGYWLVGSDGGIFTFGSAPFYGSTGSLKLQRPVVGITPTSDRGGYWLVASDGGLFSFGDSNYYGSIPGLGLAPAGTIGGKHLNAPIVGMVPSSDGNGYFMVASDGGVFAFGSARYEGSCPGIGGCSGPAVAVMPDASGNGYWLVTATGNVYTFGDAAYYGAPGPQLILVTSAVRTPDGKGYWILYANGAVTAFGDAKNLGSPAGAAGGSNPAAAVFATSDGAGYWVATALGVVFNYGDAPADGGVSGTHLNGSIIAATGF